MVEPPAPPGGPRSAWKWVVAIRTFFSRRRPGWSGGGALDVEVALPAAPVGPGGGRGGGGGGEVARPAVPVVPDVQRGRVRECPDGALRDVVVGGMHPEGQAPVPGVPVVELEGLLVVGDGRGDAAGQAHPCDVAGVGVGGLPAGGGPPLLGGGARRRPA